jgi:two-component system nitrogen regulation response regulator GlnG
VQQYAGTDVFLSTPTHSAMSTTKRTIWIVDDDRSIRWVLERALLQAGFAIESFESGDAVLARVGTNPPDAIISDIRMPGIDGLSLLGKLAQSAPGVPTIIMTAYSDLESTVAAYQGGAFEYLPKPFDVDEAIAVAGRAVALSDERRATVELAPEIHSGDIIGTAPAMQDVFRAIGRLSRSNITVLVTGESGTGKELVARALHEHSPRVSKPFIALNTAASPRDLLESELFGHERGAFTGAQTQRRGRFEQAHGGTLFLDEIGDMPAELQTRLLRVLADGEFFRVGGHEPVKVDVRIVAATHQALEQAVTEGKFREDLFHRLNVIRIQVPALRERREDVATLASHFLRQAAQELNVEVKVLQDDARERLCEFAWPGNVRQLENTCRWLTVMASGTDVRLEDLPFELRETSASEPAFDGWDGLLLRWADAELARGRTRLLDEATPRFEVTLIKAALNKTGGRRQDAASLLGWGRNTLTRKMKEHEMDDLEPGSEESE